MAQGSGSGHRGASRGTRNERRKDAKRRDVRACPRDPSDNPINYTSTNVRSALLSLLFSTIARRIVDRRQARDRDNGGWSSIGCRGYGVSLPFRPSVRPSVCPSVFASVVRISLRACVFVRLLVRLSTGKMIETGWWGWGAGGVAKNHALVEAFYYRT